MAMKPTRPRAPEPARRADQPRRAVSKSQSVLERHRTAALLVISSSSLILSLLAVALLAQAFYKPTRVYSGWKPSSKAHELEKNQLGFRGQPIQYGDADFVILLLGDSQVQANACAYDWMPERRLQFHLANNHGKDAKVFSLGAGGYGQEKELLVFREYLKSYRADLVLVWLTPKNDVWNNVFPTNSPNDGAPKPAFWLENGQLNGPHQEMGEELYMARLHLVTFFWRTFLPSRD